ncbi:MAG: DMT family transporter [Lachnospiraceae bacterium]|nr:DMT family transporter [Lachnospiraceae bacterium]
MNKRVKGTIQLSLTALIWGVAFVAQSVGMDYVGPWTFNCVRYFIGGTVLIPVVCFIALMERKGAQTASEHDHSKIKNTVIGGCISGLFLAVASLFQQYGIIETSVGKAGFITALYIIIVPFFSVLLHKKVALNQWIAAGIAVVGFYIMSMHGIEGINRGDLLLLICAVLFSCQILVIDHFVEKVNTVAMSMVQFYVCGFICLIGTMALERPTFAMITAAYIPILYAGVMSCGVAYTLQIVGQKNLEPAYASLLMSLESVFSALAGFIILGQRLSAAELTGCALVFIAVLIAQGCVNIRKIRKEA